MPAPKGNQFWKVRSSSGRKPIFNDPDALREMCEEYFEWVEANPLQEEKVFHATGLITKAEVNKMRAMTIGGLCIFLDIAKRTWDTYRDKEDFLLVVEGVEEVIRNQKFSGAAADLLNANIIARDLGLTDKSDVKHAGSLNVTMAPEDAATL